MAADGCRSPLLREKKCMRHLQREGDCEGGRSPRLSPSLLTLRVAIRRERLRRDREYTPMGEKEKSAPIVS